MEDVSTDERNISVADGILTVHGCDGLPVEIISLAGLKVYGIESAPAKVEKRLDSGVYIVRIDGKSPFNNKCYRQGGQSSSRFLLVVRELWGSITTEAQAEICRRMTDGRWFV